MPSRCDAIQRATVDGICDTLDARAREQPSWSTFRQLRAKSAAIQSRGDIDFYRHTVRSDCFLGATKHFDPTAA